MAVNFQLYMLILFCSFLTTESARLWTENHKRDAQLFKSHLEKRSADGDGSYNKLGLHDGMWVCMSNVV